jgi:hypothetical protein
MVLIVFRVQVGRLISQVRKIGAGGVNVELAEQVESVRTAGEIVEAEQKVSLPEASKIDPAILELAKSFPEAAFLQSCYHIESVLLQIRSRLPDDKPHRNLNEVLQQLLVQEYISSSVIELFNQLRKARNAAAHGEEGLSPGEALELIRQTSLLEDLLKQVMVKLPAPNHKT